MTIMDVPYILQNLVKGLILLTAIIVDTLINPRDEQTAQQGDIRLSARVHGFGVLLAARTRAISELCDDVQAKVGFA
jgi:hypothetical protein